MEEDRRRGEGERIKRWRHKRGRREHVQKGEKTEVWKIYVGEGEDEKMEACEREVRRTCIERVKVGMGEERGECRSYGGGERRRTCVERVESRRWRIERHGRGREHV